MSNLEILLLVIAICSVVTAILIFIFPYFKKKKIDPNEILNTANIGINGADSVVEVLKGIFPKNAAINIVDKVIEYAKIGVSKAEQLYLISEIGKDDRKTEAIKFTLDSLGLAGIEITPQIEAIVNGCVEAAVLGLGHNETDETPEVPAIETALA